MSNNSNKLFPTGIDPLNDLIQLKKQLAEHTDAIILLQTNQNELILAVTHQLQQDQQQKKRIDALMRLVGKQNEEIKELRNSIAPTTDAD